MNKKKTLEQQKQQRASLKKQSQFMSCCFFIGTSVKGMKYNNCL